MPFLVGERAVLLMASHWVLPTISLFKISGILVGDGEMDAYVDHAPIAASICSETGHREAIQEA